MRSIGDCARHGKAIANILCRMNNAGIDLIVILFEDGAKITYKINNDTAELYRSRAPKNLKNMIAIRMLFPQFPSFEGEHLIWAWEMVNQQGYFDALQLAFTNQHTVQFVTGASTISVCTVTDFGDGRTAAATHQVDADVS